LAAPAIAADWQQRRPELEKAVPELGLELELELEVVLVGSPAVRGIRTLRRLLAATAAGGPLSKVRMLLGQMRRTGPR
jgi:hypothetical protein